MYLYNNIHQDKILNVYLMMWSVGRANMTIQDFSLSFFLYFVCTCHLCASTNRNNTAMVKEVFSKQLKPYMLTIN